ncbi:hypothetical protein Tco_0439217 [Tanacetum coccineum]
MGYKPIGSRDTFHISDRTGPFKLKTEIVTSSHRLRQKFVFSSGIDVGNPRVHVTPVFMNGVSEFCGRVPVSGVSRLKLQHYASAYNVTLVPSVLMPKKWHSKIQVCFHGNSSIGLCQCEKDDWRSLQDGFWSSFMSPYEGNMLM